MHARDVQFVFRKGRCLFKHSGDSEGRKFFCNLRSAPRAAHFKFSDLTRKNRVRVINAEPHHVNRTPAPKRRHFNACNKADTETVSLGARLRHSRRRIVISERHGIAAALRGKAHQFRRA